MLRTNAYLQIFWNRTFPLDPSRLIKWASSIDENHRLKPEGSGTVDFETRRSVHALHVLELVTDSAVRDLALTLIESANSIGRAVGLLASNFVEGDWGFIDELTKRDLNKDDFHSLGMSILDVFHAHPSIEASQVFINLYERSPCSNCRRRFIESLDSLHGIPRWMLEECQYDANTEIRELSEKTRMK